MARLAEHRSLALAIAALGMAAFGASHAAAKTVRIIVENIGFTPAETSAAVGDTIEWVNRDFLAHTATANDGKWEVVLPPGSTKQMQVKESSALDYYCRYHPNMKGKIAIGR